MFLSNRCLRCGSITLQRFVSSSSVYNKRNHYDSLGLTPNATQTDIKTAYYKLSMQYHPDKNKGSEEAAQVFRDISEAYEVLGNLKLRKLYDKGIIHTAGPQYAQKEDPNMEMEDSQRKFYQSREHRSKAPPPTGKTTIYNFDEWTQQHYGASFERRAKAKERYMHKVESQRRDKASLHFEIITCCAVMLIIMMSYSFMKNDSYDIVKEDVEIENSKTSSSVSETV